MQQVGDLACRLGALQAGHLPLAGFDERTGHGGDLPQPIRIDNAPYGLYFSKPTDCFSICLCRFCQTQNQVCSDIRSHDPVGRHGDLPAYRNFAWSESAVEINDRSCFWQLRSTSGLDVRRHAGRRRARQAAGGMPARLRNARVKLLAAV